MLPIPMIFNADSTSIIINTCDLFVAFPSITTPTTWYDASAPISSVNATGSNTVVSNQYKRWYDHSGNGRHMDSSATEPSYPTQLYSVGLTAGFYPDYVGGETKRNGGNLFAGDFYYGGVVYSLGTAHYMRKTVSSFASSGAGTVAFVFKTAFDNVDSSYIGNHTFWIMGSSNAAGYKKQGTTIQIQGDNRSYSFSYLPNTWYVLILSVPSPGSYNFCKANNLTPSVAAFSTNGNISATSTEIRFDIFGNANNAGRSEMIGEFLYWNSALTTPQCLLLESYLKTKWCISY